MALITDLRRTLTQFTKRAISALSDDWYTPGGWFYGGAGTKTKAGSVVSETNALQLGIVWCCIKILSEDSASLPLHLYRRLPGGGKEKAINHHLYPLLHDSPNPEMTAFSFRETGKSHLLAWGNWYAEKEFGRGVVGRNQIKALWPITPNRVTVKRNDRQQIIYHVSMAGTGLPDVDMPKRNVLHIPGLSFNGLVGYSPIAAARESIGMGKSLEEFGQLYFGNGIHPSIVLSHPGKIKNIKQARADMGEAYAGLGKHHRIMLLEEAMKVEKLGIPNDEAQFLETRDFQNVDIGTRIYRLPPQMYGVFDKASTYASAEQFSLDYVVKTLRPWLVRIEQALNMWLLSSEEKGEYFFEHLIDGLMRGDSQARGEFYQKIFPTGAITPNQICEIENWNPIGPDGDKRFVPLNFIPLEDAGKPQEPAPTVDNNRAIYRSRLEKAYSPLIIDAVRRITRKEAQRVNWLQENKPKEEIELFYRDFPDYIQKQAKPAFLSFAEALLGMETELNGLNSDSFKAETEVFVNVFCRDFAKTYVECSNALAVEGEISDERDAIRLTDVEIKAFGDAYILKLKALRGVNK